MSDPAHGRSDPVDPAAGELRVAVVDDDYWTRDSVVRALDDDPRVEVVAVGTQDEATGWDDARWAAVEVLFVDVHDETVLDRDGEDVYSGIAVIERTRGDRIRTVAMSPARNDPLLTLRLVEAGADYIYHRREIPDIDALVRALSEPEERFRARLHPTWVLAEHGVTPRSRPNQAVAAYEGSPLFRRMDPLRVQTALGVSRRQIGNLRRRVAASGFFGTERRSSGGDRPSDLPRWPDTRTYLLKLLGRAPVSPRELPPSEADEPTGR